MLRQCFFQNQTAKKCRPATIETICTLGDVINSTEGGPLVTDTNAAVGPTTIVTTVNDRVAIHDKVTGERTEFTTTTEFWDVRPPQVDSILTDPVVLFDEFSQRFFAIELEGNGIQADAEMTIELPGSIAGTYEASKGSNTPSQVPFNLQGFEIVPAEPLNADTPLTNDLTGKIALVASDDFVTSSANKGDNAANAGAVGVIIFNTESNTLISIFGSNQVPTVSIGQEIGEAILANASNPGVVGGIRNLQDTEIGLNAYSRMYLAVSKDANPRTKEDFNMYVLGDRLGPWSQVFADFEKLGIDEDALYISSASFEYPAFELPDGQGAAQRFFSQIVAVEKAPLVEGKTNAPNFLVNDLQLLDPAVPFPNLGNPTATGLNAFTEFRTPTFLHTPKKNTNQVTFFVNPKLDDPTAPVTATGNKLIVTALKDVLGAPEFSTFELDIERFFAPVARLNGSRNRNVVQPSGLLQEPPTSFPPFSLNLLGTFMEFRCVQYLDSLWCTHTVGGPDVYEVRWYEIDVSHIFDATNPHVSLVQQGKIVPGGTTSAFYPSIEVDKDGNMGIGFNISGPDQPVALAHTGRLKTDPLGTVRFPLEVNFTAQPDLPFFSTGLDPATFASRWNDYTSVQLDPVDRKTFYYASGYSNQDEQAYLAFTPAVTNGLVSFQVNPQRGGGTCCTDTGSQQQPETGVKRSLKEPFCTEEEFVELLKKQDKKSRRY